jgi:acetyl esterase
MKRVALVAMTALAMLFAMGASAETREHSIERENGYIRDHAVEPVAHYWDNVEYAKAGTESLTLDISAPEGNGPFPVLMIIHGGGWYLHTNTVMEGMARYITNRGYVVFNINYRVTPAVKMETVFEDCLGALLWVKEHAAEYHGDPQRVAVTGDSAGGHLTAMILTQGNNPAFHPTYPGNGKTDATIQCAIPTYGVYDFPPIAKLVPPFFKSVMGATYKEAPDRYNLVSPYQHIRPGLPPQLVLQGSADPLYWENRKYVNALKKAGDPVEFQVYPGQPHAFLNDFWAPHGKKGYDRMIKFLDEQLKK